MLGMLKFKAA